MVSTTSLSLSYHFICRRISPYTIQKCFTLNLFKGFYLSINWGLRIIELGTFWFSIPNAIELSSCVDKLISR